MHDHNGQQGVLALGDTVASARPATGDEDADAGPPSPLGFDGLPGPRHVIGGKYRVERVLGMGGMGIVVAAHHALLGQTVAVKIMRPQAITMAGASERFLREAQNASAIRSEHVARVMDQGILPSGLPYIVMEYLEGETLDAVIRARGPLPVEDAVDWLLQACEAIAEAHALGIVHRDLKSANLMLGKRAGGQPSVKVLDFGLSKGSSANELTATYMTLGSAHTMSPEQVRCSKYADARTDVWALGVILYQLLTARLPFEGKSMFTVFMGITTDAPKRPSEHRPDLPAALEAVVLRCLEKDIDRRVQTVAELAEALAPFGSARARASAERVASVWSRRRGSMPSTPTPSRPAAAASRLLPPTAGWSVERAGAAPEPPARAPRAEGPPLWWRGLLLALALPAVALAVAGLLSEDGVEPASPAMSETRAHR